MQSQFSQRKEKEVISPEQINEYHENGYLVVSNVFSGAECDEVLRRIRPYANKDFAAIMNPDRPEYLLAQFTKCRYAMKDESDGNRIGEFVDKISIVLKNSSDSSMMAGILGLNVSELETALDSSAFLRERVMRDPKTADILETLQKREVVALMSQMLFKEAGTRYANQAWRPHQDNSYPQNQNAQYITTNLFLADADRENGTLYIYPESHKLGLLKSDKTLSYREAKTNPGNKTMMPAEWEDRHVDVNFKKGDLLVLHGNCIHGSYPNSSSRSRPLYSCSLISEGEYFYPGPHARRMEIPLR